MGSMTEASPKCLVRLGGKTLLERQIAALREASIERIAVVTGWHADQIAPYGLETFHNERWAQTNMVMSLACARTWLEAGPCVVSYSDIFYSSATVRALMDCSVDIAITYDPNWWTLWSRRFKEPLSDAETFALSGDGRVVEIGGKTHEVREINGQYMGLLKFAQRGWSKVSRLLDTLSQANCDRLDMTGLLRRLIAQGAEIAAVPVVGNWGEVDTASDLAIYESDLQRT